MCTEYKLLRTKNLCVLIVEFWILTFRLDRSACLHRKHRYLCIHKQFFMNVRFSYGYLGEINNIFSPNRLLIIIKTLYFLRQHEKYWIIFYTFLVITGICGPFLWCNIIPCIGTCLSCTPKSVSKTKFVNLFYFLVWYRVGINE